MAGLAANYVQQYVRHIVDGTPPKAEYVRHFEARTPRALGGQYVLSGGLPHSPGFAKIDGFGFGFRCDFDFVFCRRLSIVSLVRHSR